MSIWDDIKIKIASKHEWDMVEAVRRQVFVKEQKIPESKEFVNDGPATDIIAYIQKRYRKLPIGTMRIRHFSGFVMFERMAVTKNFRKTSVAQDIMQYAYDYVSMKGYTKVKAACKPELLSRWEQCGYRKSENPKPFEHNGMTLIQIECDLPPNPRALTINSDFSLLVAPEEEWFDDKPKVEQKKSKLDMWILRLRNKLQSI
ncbi:MAG: hypothetical protein IJ660_07365 [Alphaproteobacteria bacterium]|nr:hypothetical protein [Alphaproteobacteria bacterium]